MNNSLRSRSAALICASLLSGCATYHPQALPAAPDLSRSPVLTVSAGRFAFPGLKPHPFPADGLDETAVVALAVINNPDLKAARLRAGVADAQMLEAGLLSDPQISGGLARSALHSGYSLGLSADIHALITRGAAKEAAEAHTRQVNLEILWQECQVAEKARELFIDLRADGRLHRVLGAGRKLLAGRCTEENRALKRGTATAEAVSADLAALADADSQMGRLQLNANLARHQLNELLGLAPDAPFPLVGGTDSPALSRAELQSALVALPQHRADLLALRAGYQSEEQRLREAILAQFPSLSVGVDQGRSAEEGLHTVGLSVNLTLPLFNRNRGQIAIQRATRALLYQTYQARLDKAQSDAHRVWTATQIMTRRLRNLESQVRALKESAAEAEIQFQRETLDSNAYGKMQLLYRSEQADAIRQRASLDKAQAALEILLGLPIAPSPGSPPN